MNKLGARVVLVRACVCASFARALDQATLVTIDVIEVS